MSFFNQCKRHYSLSSIFFIFIIFTSSVVAQAPDDKYGEKADECKQNLSIYFEYYKAKNYGAAFEAWQWCLDNCPKASKNLYIHSEKILGHQMKNAKSEEDKKKFYDQLMTLYDQRNEIFPGREAYVLGRKALTMKTNSYASNQDTYDIFVKAIEADVKKAEPSTLYAMFQVVIDLYKEQTKGISAEVKEARKELKELGKKAKEVSKKRSKVKKRDEITKLDKEIKELNEEIKAKNANLKEKSDIKNEKVEIVFDVYDILYPAIEYNLEYIPTQVQELEAVEKPNKKQKRLLKTLPKKIKNFEKIKSSIDKKLEPLATCDKLEGLYTKKFEERKTDAKWLKKALSILTLKKCIDAEVYEKIVGASFDLEPTAGAARAAAILARKNKDTKKALEFYMKAVELETEDNKKADDYMNIAKIQRLNKSYASARTNAQKAAQSRGNWGEPYLLIGNLYASSANQCGKDPFEKKSVYWAALEEFKKARSIDPSVTKEANKLIKSYVSLAPTKEETFMRGNVSKVSIECWINKTVKVPNN